MTLTTKPLETTLSVAEQIELRRIMKNPTQEYGVNNDPTNISKMLMCALAEKGYVELTESRGRYDYYKLKAE